jgi:DNA polymerase-3 subunit beta
VEFSATRDDLLKELNLVQGIVERKNTVPILANVLLDAGTSEVEVSATDLDVALRSSFAAEVKERGAMTLSAKKLFEIVRASDEGRVEVRELENHWAAIHCGRSFFKMVGLSRSEFPALPEPPAKPAATMPGALLREMIQKTIFAITSEDSRYYLNGALLEIRPEGPAMVATDGHRLAYVSAAAGGSSASSTTKVIVPRKTLSELLKVIGDVDHPVEFSMGENHLFFAVAGRHLVSKRVETQFPAWERVIPKENDKQVEMDRDQFSRALRRVSLLANERSRAVRIAVSAGKMEISSQNPDLGEARETIDVDYAAPDVQVSFNGQYLLDFATAVTEPRIRLELKDDSSQGLLQRSGEASGVAEYRYVVMPMRL